MLKLVDESFPAHKTPAPRHTPARLLPGAGSALLENQPTRAHALDVQHRQPAAGDGSLPREAALDQARSNLDDPRPVHLDTLRRPRVGRVSHFDTGARRRACSSAARDQ